jgi:DNA mismatch repair protein MutS2
VVTTHFSNLKNFAATHKGLENASMLFDHENMQPLYRLELGRPGSSYAFELATKSGLPEHIINYAKNKVGGKQKKVDDLLLELEKEQKQVALLKEKLLEKEKSAAASLEKYQALASTIEEHKKTLMKQAKQEALAIVTEANSKVEAVIRDIKKGQADIESQRKARLEIKQDIVELKEELAIEAEEELPVPVQVDGKIEIGSFVQMTDQDTVGEVLELSKNKAIVNFGNLKTTVDLKKLKKVAKPSIKKVVNSAAKGIDLNEKMMQFKPELNLIATRADEAIKVLERYLDDAYLLGIKEVKIVHGKGYGILRKVIREFLNNSKLVVKVKDEHIDFGGDGISVVTLNTQ